MLGRFAIDFVVVKDRSGRPGRRTPSSSTSARAEPPTPSSPCSSSPTAATTRRRGLFLTPAGREKHLVATDHLESPLLRGLSVDDLFDIVARHGLHFDQARQIGVVFHMISCLTEHGRVGLTAVGDTPADADAIYQRAEQILQAEARDALDEPLPIP